MTQPRDFTYIHRLPGKKTDVIEKTVQLYYGQLAALTCRFRGDGSYEPVFGIIARQYRSQEPRPSELCLDPAFRLRRPPIVGGIEVTCFDPISTTGGKYNVDSSNVARLCVGRPQEITEFLLSEQELCLIHDVTVYTEFISAMDFP